MSKQLKNFNRALKAAQRIVDYYDECRRHDVVLNEFERMQARVADALLRFAPKPAPDVTPDVENDYQSFWRGIVENPDGTLNVAQVKKELSDFSKLLDYVPQVYSHVTGGTISKVMTDPKAVCTYADDHYSMLADDDTAEAVSAATADAWCDNQAMRLILTAVIEHAKVANTVLNDFADCVAVDQIARRLDEIIAMAGPARHEEYQYGVQLCRLMREVSLFGQFAAEVMAYFRDGCNTHQRMLGVERLTDIVKAGMRCDAELMTSIEGNRLTADWFKSTGAVVELLDDARYFVTWKRRTSLTVMVNLVDADEPTFEWRFHGILLENQPQDIPSARITMLALFGKP